MTAMLYRADGREEPIAPEEGKVFGYEQIRRTVGGAFGTWTLPDKTMLVFAESGLLRGLPVNWEASRRLQAAYPDRQTQTLVGDVVVCPRQMMMGRRRQ